MKIHRQNHRQRVLAETLLVVVDMAVRHVAVTHGPAAQVLADLINDGSSELYLLHLRLVHQLHGLVKYILVKQAQSEERFVGVISKRLHASVHFDMIAIQRPFTYHTPTFHRLRCSFRISSIYIEPAAYCNFIARSVTGIPTTHVIVMCMIPNIP